MWRSRHCEGQRDEAIQTVAAETVWIASLALAMTVEKAAPAHADLVTRKDLAACQSRRCKAKRARKLSTGARRLCLPGIERSPILPQSEEGQHGGNDDNQTDQIDDLVHVTLRSFAP
jgi:hypothetical protein